MRIPTPGGVTRASAVLLSLGAIAAISLPAQAIVGYGALTGASSVGASSAKSAGAATARTMRRVGGALSAASAGGERSVRAADGVVRLGFGKSEATPNSIVVFAAWGSDDEAPVRPAATAAAAGQPPTAPDRPAASAEPAPRTLKRGAKIEDVIAELGRPALVINGSGTAGYDRKYVFRSGDGERRAVLVLGDLVVDWGDEQ